MSEDKPSRFEIALPASQRAELEHLARAAGVSSTGLARMSITQMLARKDLVLTGEPPGDPFVTFLQELGADARASDPAWMRMAAVLAEALEGLDREADGNPSACALADCLRIVAGARGSIEARIKVMSQLVNTRGTVAVLRELLYPKRTKRKGT